MIAEYKCLFGISSPIPELPIRHYDVTYNKDLSSMTITGKGGRVFWFLFSRMHKIYRAGDIPRFSESDAREFAQESLDLPILPQGRITFRDLWKNRETYTLVATEEADYKHWSWGRFACLGDSVHKMTPNMGAGGNAAIETAAALANEIHGMLEKNRARRSSFEDVRQALANYQKQRQLRASATVKLANFMTRIHALKGIAARTMALYVMPNAGDLFVDLASDGWIGATLLNYLPPPPRSLTSNMPFNPKQGLGREESKLYRAIGALPLLVMACWHYRIFKRLVPWKTLNATLLAGEIKLGVSRPFYFPIFQKFYHIKFLDDFWRGATVLFAPSTLGYDPVSSWQMQSFLPDVGLVYSILLIESARRANKLTISQMYVTGLMPLISLLAESNSNPRPLVFGLALQCFGAGTILPLYYFFHYTSTPIANFKATDMRLTDLRFTFTVLPVIASVYYFPYLLAYLAPSLRVRHAATLFWQMAPFWATIAQQILARTFIPDTIQHDRIHNVTRDLWPIRITIAALASFSGIKWLRTIFRAPFSLSAIFVPSGSYIKRKSLQGAMQEFLKHDQLFFSVSSLLWIVYLFSDLKRARMVSEGWMRLLAKLGAVTAMLGPGAATGLAWLWREEILATKRHYGAIVQEEGKGMMKLNVDANGHTEKKSNGRANGHSKKKGNGSVRLADTASPNGACK